LYLVHQRGEGSDPDRILIRDVPLIIDILVWLAVVVVVLYGHSLFGKGLSY
jgi:hypothetical protein